LLRAEPRSLQVDAGRVRVSSVISLQNGPLSKRVTLGAIAALLLAFRLLSPAGFMPAFDGGSVTIVACPDAEIAPSHAPAHHHGPTTAHPGCPYAAASSLSFVGGDVALLATAILAGTVIAAAVALAASVHQSRHLRPFLRGPPFPA
jgi:hypothetical protein